MRKNFVLILFIVLILSIISGCKEHKRLAEDILENTGVEGGVVVHLGVETGHLTAALYADNSYVVHGLAQDKNHVEEAREYIRDKGLYGKVSVEKWNGKQLPYVTNMVNLVVAKKSPEVSMEEIMRVLSPNGVAYIRKEGKWISRKKSWPQGMYEWNHYLYNTTNNAVSQDTIVGPPRHLQWVGGPEWARHHDQMSSMSASVSSNGRIFYIMDEGPTSSIMLSSDWNLIARDAFNGTILWRKDINKWVHRLWKLKSGPAQLPRRLVAHENHVFVTLSIDGPVKKLDAATGKVLKTYENTTATEEILYSDGILYLVVNNQPRDTIFEYQKKLAKFQREEAIWKGNDRYIKAINAQTGKCLWKKKTPVLPLTLTVDDSYVYFCNGKVIQALDRDRGLKRWKSDTISRASKMLSFFAPTLVVHDDVVLFAGGERAGQQTGRWYIGNDRLTALSAKNGEKLWSCPHPASGYRSPEDFFVINDVVWVGNIQSGLANGQFTGRDLHTGKIKSEFLPDVSTHWFHHRCFRNKATEQYIIGGRTGIEYIDVSEEHWDVNHWIRGTCLYGTMPANGLTYVPPHPCACFPEGKLSGFNAVASSRPGRNSGNDTAQLVKGPAYASRLNASDNSNNNEWPTYRHDMRRSGHIKTTLKGELKTQWETKLGGELSTLVMADNTIYVAQKNTHTLYALSAKNGNKKWSFTVGGRIDSPPTIDKGRIIFGSRDGWVYCLAQKSGELIWKFRAAPDNKKIMSYGQLESLWPVHGNVLVKDGEVWFVAGRSAFLDGGLYLYRLDVCTGQKRSVTQMDKTNPKTGENLQQASTFLTMPVGLPDVLSTDDKYVYMRSQKFDMKGKRVEIDPMPGESYEKLMNQEMKSEISQMFNSGVEYSRSLTEYYHLFLDSIQSQKTKENHLFSAYGFLDDSWFHRSYWIYGRYFIGGWNGYYMAGKYMPAGRILVYDNESVYGFARRPEYYGWTTPMEYHLFSIPKNPHIDTSLEDDRVFVEPMNFSWSNNIPVLVRAMVLTNNTLFISGPPDLVDEEAANKHFTDSLIQVRLEKQKKALHGKEGGVLWAIDSETGEVKTKYKIDSPPVWDGLIAAQNNLFMATMNGNIICLGKVSK